MCDLFKVAVAAADPAKTIPQALPPKPPGRVVVVGAGKASARMAEIVEQEWGPCEGLVVTRYGYSRPVSGIEIVEASHPVSDQAGEVAAKRLLALLDSLGEKDFVLALISGGGSALLCAPPEPLTLADIQATHEALLASGAPIGAMNLIRKHVSAIQGGQLAAAAYPAKTLALLISDVPGDNPGEIASGPTVAEDRDASSALACAAQYEIPLPDTVLAALTSGSSVVRSDDSRLSNTLNRIIAAPQQSLDAAEKHAEAYGLKVIQLGDAIEGEAREEAQRQVKFALQIQAEMQTGDSPVLVLSGGECTVTGWGGGVGGPNAEFALAAAIALEKQPGIHLIACDTDGVDGAAEVAGAYVHPETLELAAKQNLDSNNSLTRNDSHSFFAAIGDQVVTGPTLTNVNDFRAILIFPQEA